MGQLVYLPAGVRARPGCVPGDVLTGWRRAQLAQNFSPDTARRRVASVLRMGDFVGSYPWQWTRLMPMISSVIFAVCVTWPIPRCVLIRPM